MATTPINLPHASRFTTWFSDFLRQELAPYPGRGAIVARVVIAATLSSVLMVTFRIPGGATGTLFAFILSRENLLSTVRSAITLLAAFAFGGLFIPVGARFFAAVPEMHFLWEAVSLFAVFFLLRTLNDFALATGLGLVTTNILSTWYLPGPANRNVELTLWQVAAALIGAVVTLAVEVVFHAISKSNELLDGIDARLEQIEILLRTYGSGSAIDPKNAQKVSQYAIVGVGGIRRNLARSNVEPRYRARVSVLASLTGRSIDFSAALVTTTPTLNPADQQRATELSQKLAELRRSLGTAQVAAVSDAKSPGNASLPLLDELEMLILLLPSVFASESNMDPRLEVLENPSTSNRLFAADAFTNPEYLRFALAGTMAAMICYVLYVGLAWPSLSTSVTTCVLTALSNIGSSRQKQILRIVGATLGGFVLGMGAQIFILPSLDSIGGFAMLIAVVSGIAAWVSTSSARLSYAGLQIALAFYLINLSEPTIQTSLTIARDRTIGVLLGSSMMWLVFERLYPRPAANEMVRLFVGNLRHMATLVRISNSGVDTATVLRIRRERDYIYKQFGDVNAQADAVPFETGPERAGHMAARDRIRRWQASLRTFYLLEAPLIQFRIFGDEHQRERPFAHLQDDFRERCATAFDAMATCLENQLFQRGHHQTLVPDLVDIIESAAADAESQFSERERSLLHMSGMLAGIVDRMQREMANEPLYSISITEPNPANH